MGETNHQPAQIFDLASFRRLGTGLGHIATLYYWHQMDWLVDIAYAISADFFRRPQMYSDLEEETSAKMVALYFRYGADERMPSKQQRVLIFTPFFGNSASSDRPSGARDQFTTLRDGVLLAVNRFLTQPAPDSIGLLRHDVATRAYLLRAWTQTSSGTSTRMSSEKILPALTEDYAYTILRDPVVTAAFGVPGGLAPAWPYHVDSRAETFVEEVSTALAQVDSALSPLSRAGLGNLQTVALRGAEAIAEAVRVGETQPNTDAAVDRVVSTGFAWLSSLQCLGDPHAYGLTSTLGSNGLSRPPYVRSIESQTAI